jgi:hypothetical protein
MKKIFDTREEKRIADIVEKHMLLILPTFYDRMQIRAFAKPCDPDVHVEIFFDGFWNGGKKLAIFVFNHDVTEDQILLDIMMRVGDFQEYRRRLEERFLRERTGIDGTVPPRKSI